MITQELLKELFDYDPETGILRWKKSTSTKVKPGDVAGSLTDRGYLRVWVLGKSYRVHRLVWMWTYGRWPAEQIDHINGVRHDNRLKNLRECTNAENHQNLRVYCNNTSGTPGVHRHKPTRKFQAYIRSCGRKKHLGYFDTPEEAHAAYLKAKAELHEFNPIPRHDPSTVRPSAGNP